MNDENWRNIRGKKLMFLQFPANIFVESWESQTIAFMRPGKRRILNFSQNSPQKKLFAHKFEQTKYQS